MQRTGRGQALNRSHQRLSEKGGTPSDIIGNCQPSQPEAPGLFQSPSRAFMASKIFSKTRNPPTQTRDSSHRPPTLQPRPRLTSTPSRLMHASLSGLHPTCARSRIGFSNSWRASICVLWQWEQGILASLIRGDCVEQRDIWSLSKAIDST